MNNQTTDNTFIHESYLMASELQRVHPACPQFCKFC
jgi:hypothetical protein